MLTIERLSTYCEMAGWRHLLVTGERKLCGGLRNGEWLAWHVAAAELQWRGGLSVM